MTETHKTLATFRIKAGKWNEFKTLARRHGSNASEVLIGLIDAYLAGGAMPPHHPVNPAYGDELSKRIDNLEKRLSQRIEALEQQPEKSAA